MERVIYKIENMPVFQNVTYATPEEAKACPTGTIELVQNMETGLIYNKAFQPIEYDENYQNEQGLSPAFKEHLERVSEIVLKHLGTDLIEIGCGKGAFLELLQSKGANIVGYDTVYQGNNPNIKKEYYTGEGNLILRHVLEHIPNPLEFLKQLKGRIYIEVPCFDWICENGAYFDICYEHVNYFRLSDLRKMFKNVIDSGKLFGGQYIYVVADLDLADIKRTDFVEVNFPKAKKAGNIVWGAATKGVVYSILNQVDLAIDINPAKQNRYLPVSGVKVVSPDEFLKTYKTGEINIMNPVYEKEIRAMAGNGFSFHLL